MAQINEESIVITLSQISKAKSKFTSQITEDLMNTLESVAQELVGPGVIVEVDIHTVEE
jgi:hypothetical protein